MFAKTLCVLLIIGLAAGNPTKHFFGVDPNSLTCDIAGEIVLLLPHFTDCAYYYHCDHGKEVERRCALGTIFDFELQTCNHAWATKCWLRDRDIEEGSGSGSGDDNEDSWSQHEEAPKPAPVHFQPQLNCNNADSASRQLVYKGDCQRFWRCQDGSLVTAYCSDGLFFNSQSQMCDFESNVKCDTALEDELQGEFIVYK